jgi:putative phosphoribosyl transferase
VLAGLLGVWEGRDDVVVLALPRGGVQVAARVAEALAAPLDTLPVRRIRLPDNPRVVIGAVARGAAPVLMRDTIAAAGINDASVHELVREARIRLADSDRYGLALGGRVVLLVDDGLATGTTIRAALAAVRGERPARVVVCVPVASRPAVEEIAGEVDELVSALTPARFGAVSLFYEDFSDPPEEELAAILARARARPCAGAVLDASRGCSSGG